MEGTVRGQLPNEITSLLSKNFTSARSVLQPEQTKSRITDKIVDVVTSNQSMSTPKYTTATSPDGPPKGKGEIRIIRLCCRIGCFPLLQRNLRFAEDIHTRCQKAFDNVGGKNVPKRPRILGLDMLQLYIATKNDSENNTQEVSAVMGKHDYNEFTDVTEKCFQRDRNIVTPDQDCSCLISFLQKDEANISVPEQSKVLHFPSTETEASLVRREIAKILGEELFIYAEEVQKRLDEETINLSPESEKMSHLQNTKEAVTILLTRKIPRDEMSTTTEYKIPDDIDSHLNGMKTVGVMAFGLFDHSFIVFLDEECSDEVKKDTTQEVENICSKQEDFKIPVKVLTVPQKFLIDTALEQGCKVIGSEQDPDAHATIGMVTKATKPLTTEITKEVVGATASYVEKNGKNIVVVLTAGHFFAINDDAFFVKNGQLEKFGKCLASLHPPRDHTTLQYDIAVIEVNENMTARENCSLQFKNETDESCDCILFQGTLASGAAVYKKGASTQMTQGVVVSEDFRLVGLIDTQKGYLIKGRDGGVFSGPGDSGSIVFTLADQDAENAVNVVSIVSKMMPENVTRILEYPVTLSYTARLDKCLEKLHERHGVTVQMPKI